MFLAALPDVAALPPWEGAGKGMLQVWRLLLITGETISTDFEEGERIAYRTG